MKRARCGVERGRGAEVWAWAWALCAQCGVGMVLKQTRGELVVKRLAPGGPAESSGRIESGDVLVKVCAVCGWVGVSE